MFIKKLISFTTVVFIFCSLISTVSVALAEIQLSEEFWAQRISIGGDIRLRYEGSLYDETNAAFLDPAHPDTVLNSTIDRKRFTYRVRLDTKAKLVEGEGKKIGRAEVGLRLSSGNENNPISTNVTMGDYLKRDGIQIDRAYLKWTLSPNEQGREWIPQLVLTGGRIPNPWFKTSSLVWDDDLNFEGVALNFSGNTHISRLWNLFFTLGGFSLQEEELSSDRDKWLYGGQVGIEFNPGDSFSTTISAAYFDYVHVEGIVNSTEYPNFYDFTAPEYQRKGNTLIDIDPSSEVKTALAADYNLAHVTFTADYSRFSPIDLSLMAEGVLNIGFDKDAVAERAGIDNVAEDILGYCFGFRIGHSTIRDIGDWFVSMEYRRLESDAVLDSFTDSDFHEGGTNAKGWGLSLGFGLLRDMWMKVKWMSADEASEASPQFAVDLLQVDLNARF